VKTRAKNRSRKSKQTNGQSPKETPVGAMVYSGPISSPSFHQAINLKTVPLLLDTQLTSTGGSVINNVYSSSPSTCADWSGASSIWKEFRTLGFRIDYVPNLKYATTNRAQFTASLTTTLIPHYRLTPMRLHRLLVDDM
jgi:hypothetical protein